MSLNTPFPTPFPKVLILVKMQRQIKALHGTPLNSKNGLFISINKPFVKRFSKTYALYFSIWNLF